VKKLLILLSCFLLSQFSIAGKHKGNASLGVVSSGGNTETTTIEAKLANQYTFRDSSSISYGGHYLFGQSFDIPADDTVLTARNWDLFTKYNRQINAKWGYFLGQQVEGDTFANINERYNTDLGIGYQIIKNDRTSFSAELGGRYTVERFLDTTPTENFVKARLFGNITHKFSETVSGGFWAEYIPNFTESEDWNFNFEPSLNVQLSKIFSLKVAFLGQYDNLPIGALRDRNFDFQYTTYLVANF